MGTYHRPKIREADWQLVERMATERGETTAAVLSKAIEKAHNRTRGDGADALRFRMCREVLARAVKDLIRYEGAVFELRREVRAAIAPQTICGCAMLDEIDRCVSEVLGSNAALRRDLFRALELLKKGERQ